MGLLLQQIMITQTLQSIRFTHGLHWHKPKLNRSLIKPVITIATVLALVAANITIMHQRSALEASEIELQKSQNYVDLLETAMLKCLNGGTVGWTGFKGSNDQDWVVCQPAKQIKLKGD